MDDAARNLWASVYASAYHHLIARDAARYQPTKYDHPDPRYGIGTVGAHEYAVQQADYAVRIFLEKASAG